MAIDEAYIDFVINGHERFDFKAHKNVYILRSMTKIYHLAGVRLGYVLADTGRIARLKKRKPTWSVNAVAQALGGQFLKNDDFLNNTRSYYKNETARLKEALQSLGFELIPSDTHYFLMAAEDDEKLIRHMLERGIVLRHTRNFNGLDGRYVRICTREREANDRLIEALGQYKELS